MESDLEELRLVPSIDVIVLLGKSYKTLRKLENDPDACFPKKIVINGRKFFRFVEIRNWINDMQIQSETMTLHYHGDKSPGAAE
ncbi:MAG: hypothetical protein ACLPSW_08310 [Roseiarcus sp.]